MSAVEPQVNPQSAIRNPQSGSVSLVIPARNAAATLRPCLEAVGPLLQSGTLTEIIVVDDGSTDDTACIAESYAVKCTRSAWRGTAGARNLGWRAATSPVIWFLDSDCVSYPDAPALLLKHLDDPQVGAVGGSLDIANPQSLLARLVHEEIVERHRRMPSRVNFLAAANVMYRRSILEQMGGFDERYKKAEDAELAFRVMAAGYQLGFEFASRVKHHYVLSWRRYFSAQRREGYWRVMLHLTHRGHAVRDSYSNIVDHVQPPLAMLILASLLGIWNPYSRWVTAALTVVLIALQVPMTLRLIRRKRQLGYAAYALMSAARSFWRGIGMTQGVLAVLFARNKLNHRDTEAQRY